MASINANIQQLFKTAATFIAESVRGQLGIDTVTEQILIHDESSDTLIGPWSADSKQVLLAGAQPITGAKTFSATTTFSGAIAGGPDINASGENINLSATAGALSIEAIGGNLNLTTDNGLEIVAASGINAAMNVDSPAPFIISNANDTDASTTNNVIIKTKLTQNDTDGGVQFDALTIDVEKTSAWGNPDLLASKITFKARQTDSITSTMTEFLKYDEFGSLILGGESSLSNIVIDEPNMTINAGDSGDGLVINIAGSEFMTLVEGGSGSINMQVPTNHIDDIFVRIGKILRFDDNTTIEIGEIGATPSNFNIGSQANMNLSTTGNGNIILDSDQRIDLTADTIVNIAAPTGLNITSTTGTTITGNVGLQSSISASVGLRAMPVALTGADQFGSLFDVTGTVGATASIVGAASVARTPAVVMTCAELIGYRIAQGSAGAGSTITVGYGLKINPVVAGITKYSIYTEGTALIRFGGELLSAASTTANASINIPAGTAPTSPVSGDLWYDGTNLKFRDGGTTRTITWV